MHTNTKTQRKMKKVLASPPTPTQKRQKKSTTLASSSSDRELRFMESTFRVVGYQPATSDDEEEEEVQSVTAPVVDSVFQPNMRKKLAKGKLDLVRFISTNYSVPRDFETSTRFGPHSGLCYEDRLITAYEWRQILPMTKFQKMHETDSEWKMCWKCLGKGDHLAREGCPKEG